MTAQRKMRPASRALLWIVTLIVLAGWGWTWLNTGGGGDVEIQIILNVFIDAIWLMIVLGVATVLAALGVIGSLLVRGKV